MKAIVIWISVCSFVLLAAGALFVYTFGMDFLLRFSEREIYVGEFSQLKSRVPVEMSLNLPKDIRAFPLYAARIDDRGSGTSDTNDTGFVRMAARNDGDTEINISVRVLDGNDLHERIRRVLKPSETFTIFEGDLSQLMNNMTKEARYVRNQDGNYADVGSFVSFRTRTKVRSKVAITFQSDFDVNLDQTWKIYSYLGPDAP